MRRLLALLVVVSVMAVYAAGSGPAIWAAAGAIARLGQLPPGIDPKLPVSRWISGKKDPVKTWDDLTKALSAEKNYTIYKIDCSEHVVVADDDKTWQCPRKSKDDPTNKPECDDCVAVGYFEKNVFRAADIGGGFMGFVKSPIGITTLGAAGALGAYGLSRGGGEGTALIPFNLVNGGFQGNLSLTNPGGACVNFTNPAVIRFALSNVTEAGTGSAAVTDVAVGAVFNGTFALTRIANNGGFNLTIAPATTGTLTSRATGVVNAQGTQISQIDRPVTRADGSECRYAGSATKQ